MSASARLHSPVRWYGGKGRMVSKLLRLVPPGGRPYCEPYCGGASLFFAREPVPVEVLNDLNGDLVNLFRVLQDKAMFEEFAHRARFTLYSRSEFIRALEVIKSGEGDPVTRAWAMFVAMNQGFSGTEPTKMSQGRWSRTFVTNGGMANNTSKWCMRLTMLEDWHRRLLRAQVDCRDACEVIEYWDNDDAVFYVDPPYIKETRKARSKYLHECDNAHHEKLVQTLLQCRGAVVLSGYAHPIYTPLEEAGWHVVDYETACHAAGRIRGSNLMGTGAALMNAPRIERVWMNPRAIAQTELGFGGSA